MVVDNKTKSSFRVNLLSLSIYGPTMSTYIRYAIRLYRIPIAKKTGISVFRYCRHFRLFVTSTTFVLVFLLSVIASIKIGSADLREFVTI